MQTHRLMRYQTVRPCNRYIVTLFIQVARYLLNVNHTRHNPLEDNTMNDRINYSGLVDLNFNNHDEPEPDLREWPVAQSDKPAATQRDQTRPNKAVVEG
jgi:hypothetical protein